MGLGWWHSFETLLLPVAWLHIPKTGTSFLNTLVHSICVPPILPIKVGVSEHTYWRDVMDLSRCNFTSQHKSYGSPPTGVAALREPFTDTVTAHHGITLLRQPEQRIISGFHYNFHGYDLKHGEPNITVYARAVAGCSVRLLVRASHPSQDGRGITDCSQHSPPPSEKEIHHAKAVLGVFQFVGLADEWDLTACLWHARFGPTSCHASEFLDQRPGGHRNTSGWYDTSVLQDFKDQYDGSLYEHARTLFWNDVERHNLTRAQCAAWKAACAFRDGV